MLQLSDEDLILRVTDFEDFFVERKTSSDKKDWVPATVALANSAPPGYPAVLFIGVRNDGTIEDTLNLDKLQHTFSELMSNAYPPIATFPKVLRKEGKQFLAVLIPGSPERPHFSGPSYIRDGSKTIRASDRQFENLIAERNSKVREILKWKGKEIYVRFWNRLSLAGRVHDSGGGDTYELIDCNQFYVTLKHGGMLDTIPVQRVDLSIDHRSTPERLRLEVDLG